MWFFFAYALLILVNNVNQILSEHLLKANNFLIPKVVGSEITLKFFRLILNGV